MNKEFLPYEQALALKELGFNEDCFGRYQPEMDKSIQLFLCNPENRHTSNDDLNLYIVCSAPLYQQAFDWFRINHNLLSWIYSSNNVEYWYAIIGNGRFVKAHDGEETYEKAKLECLKQLIKFVKESQETKTPKKEIEVNIMITDCEDEKIESCIEYIKDLLQSKTEWEVEFINEKLTLK